MADERPDTNIFGTSTYWRASMKMPRFLMFDARVLAAFLLLVFHLRMWTFGVLCVTALALWLIETYGYRFPNALRGVRSLIAGRDRPAFARNRYRTARDVGFETHPMMRHRMARYAHALEGAQRQRMRAETSSAPRIEAATVPARRPTPARPVPPRAPRPEEASLGATPSLA